MSAGARIAARYRSVSSEKLRTALGEYVRNPRARAAIDIVLTERQEAYQRGYDAAQVLLDVVSGENAQTLHDRAVDTSIREARAQRYLESEQALGMANALWDYLKERSDI